MGLNSLFRVIVLAVFIASIAHETTSDVVHHKQNLRQYHMTRDAEFDLNYINGKQKYIAIPHHSDCRSYYVVNHRGNFIRLVCREGKLFDNESLQCKRREEAKCWRKHRQDDGEISSNSKAAKKKFECPFDFGSFPDPEDCSRWYLCLFAKPQNRKCRQGELYDKIKKECAEKSTVDCNADSEKDDEDEEKFKCPYTYGEYPYPKDCSKYFLCKQKKSSVAECKEGKLFDTKKKECRAESKVDCGSRFNPNAVKTSSRPDPTPTEKSKNLSTVAVVETTTAKDQITGVTGMSTQSPSDQTSTVPNTDSENIPTSTTAINNIQTSTTNKESSRTDSDSSASDDIIDLQSTTINEVSESSKTTMIDSTLSSNEPGDSSSNLYSTTDSNVIQKSTTFPDDISLSTTISNEIELSSTDSVNMQHSTSDSEEFQPSTSDRYEQDGSTTISGNTVSEEPQTIVVSEQTLSPTSATDDVTPSSEVDAHTEEITTTTSVQESTSIQTSTSGFDPKSFECPTPKGNFIHPGNCAAYYSCMKGNWELKLCSDDMNFHEIIRMCRDKSEVDCGKRSYNDINPVTSSPEVDTHTEEITTTTFVQESTSIQTSTSRFDPMSYECPTKKGNFIHPENCSAYFFCMKGKWELRLCPDDMNFHETIGMCQDKNHVDCGKRIAANSKGYSTVSSVQPTWETTISTEESQKFSCSEENGYFPYERDCSLFYSCRSSITTLEKCPIDTLFDTRLSRCFYENEVDCGERMKLSKGATSSSEDSLSATKAKGDTGILISKPNFACPNRKGRSCV